MSNYSNALRLCPLCHSTFGDMLNPGWVFFPEDLDFFIDFELSDRRAREASPRPRLVPDSISYLNHPKEIGALPPSAEYPTYARYALGPEQWPLAEYVTGEKVWDGHPLAAIRMAWRVLGAVRNDIVPREVRQKLEYLLNLYREPTAPPVEGRLSSRLSPSPSSHGNRGPGGGNGKAGHRPSDTKRRRPRAVEQTLAGRRPRREQAGKRSHDCVDTEPQQPLYHDAGQIMLWIQGVHAI